MFFLLLSINFGSLEVNYKNRAANHPDSLFEFVRAEQSGDPTNLGGDFIFFLAVPVCKSRKVVIV